MRSLPFFLTANRTHSTCAGAAGGGGEGSDFEVCFTVLTIFFYKTSEPPVLPLCTYVRLTMKISFQIYMVSLMALFLHCHPYTYVYKQFVDRQSGLRRPCSATEKHAAMYVRLLLGA